MSLFDTNLIEKQPIVGPVTRAASIYMGLVMKHQANLLRSIKTHGEESISNVLRLYKSITESRVNDSDNIFIDDFACNCVKENWYIVFNVYIWYNRGYGRISLTYDKDFNLTKSIIKEANPV